MKISIAKTRNHNKWTAYHNEWGTASGRMHTLLWDSKEEVEKWISEQEVYTGFYSPIPYILPQDLVGTIVEE